MLEFGKVVAQVQAQNQEQWSKKDNSKAPYRVTSKRPFIRPNVGPLYKPGDGRPKWNDTYNTPPIWNGPLTNPNTHRYGPPEKGKMFVCYNCGELGHMIRECPHLRKQVGYEPLCGFCKEKGHIANTCMAPAPVKQIQIEEFEDSRNVNYIKQISLDEKDVYITRSQAKAQAKVAPRESEPEHGSDADSKKPNDKVIRDSLKGKKSVTFEEKIIPIIPPVIPDPLQTPTQSIPIVSDKPQSNTVLLQPETLKEIPKSSIHDPSISLKRPAFYRPPKKAPKIVNLGPRKRKYNRTMKLEVGMEPYDLLSNMDNIQPQISLRQLLAVAPTYRSALSSSLVRKRPKTVDVVNEINNFEEIVDVNDISIDPSAPTVEVFIDGSLIEGVQIDSESSVNLMNADTMEEIGLTTMTTTPIILRMVD